MSFEERMEQLGRRAIEQEPQELSLPRCIRAAEQHKPVSCIRTLRIERHGFGEGRLPIPGITIRDKDASSKDAASKQQQQQHADWDSPGNKSSARKAGKLLRPSQQQAQQQTDAIKARKSAAKAFSEALDRRNANLLQRNSKGGGSAPAPADENHPASPPQASRRASLTQQPLVERHIPPRLEPDPASAAATPRAAQADAGSDATGVACSAVRDVPPCSSASSSLPAAVIGEAAAAAAAVAVAGSDAGAGQCTAAEAARTFLTDPGSQPPSPMRAVPAAGAGLAAAAACTESTLTAAGMGAAAADTQADPELAAGGVPVLQAAAVVGQHNSLSPPAAAHSVTEAAGAHGDGAGKHAFSTADASSRLLCFAHGASPPPRLGPPPPAAAASPVASGRPAHAAGMTPSSFGAVLQRPCSPRTQHPASPIRRPGSPHWAPVPPKTQLQPPLVVRPMAEWVCEQEPLQQVPRAAQEEQGSPAPVLSGRRGGAVAGAVMSSSTAAAAAPTTEASEGVCQAGRRVSVSTASVRSTASRGSAAKKQRSGAGIVAAAAFSSPELDRLVAAATEQVAKWRLVLPALCSCGHGTSVLDPSYPRHCCSNCPLRQHNSSAAYEQLLAGLLSCMGLGG